MHVQARHKRRVWLVLHRALWCVSRGGPCAAVNAASLITSGCNGCWQVQDRRHSHLLLLLLLPVPLPHLTHTQRAGATAAEKAEAKQQAAEMAAAVAEHKALLLQAGLDVKEAAKQAAKAAAKQVEQQEWAAWEQELREMAADPATAHIAARLRADMDAAAKA